MFSVAAAHEEIRRRCVSHEGTDAVDLAVAMMDAGVVRTQSAIAASCTRGPRCCKRTTFAVLAAASAWLRDTLGVPVAARGGLECPFYARNSECLGRDCVFFPAKRSQEVRHG